MFTADHIDELLRARGFVLTQQRRLIVGHLCGNMSHPTAAQIHSALAPRVTLSTVYNTLALLKDLGALTELPQSGGESRFDPNTSAHHHLLCTTCGALHDLPAEAVEVTLLVPAEIERVQVSFQGQCPGGCPA